MATTNSLKTRQNYGSSRLETLVRLFGSKGRAAVPRAVRLLQGAVWFEFVRLQLGQKSAYGVGKLIQPHTYASRAGSQWPQHHNLWAKYARGAHLPGNRTREAANALVPGSSSLLTAGVWQALDTSRSLGELGEDLLHRLRPGVQQAIFEPRALQAGNYVRRTSRARLLRMLQGHADLDGVAALVILLREARERGDLACAFEIGRSLYSALLMATISTPFELISPELFEFFRQVIFPLASDAEIEFALEQDEFQEQRLLLLRSYLYLEDAGSIKSERVTTRVQRDILSGRYGFDLLFGLEPRLRLRRPLDEVSGESRRMVASTEVARKWGLDVLRRGRRVPLVPNEVMERIANA